MKKFLSLALCCLSMAYAQAEELTLCNFESYETGTPFTMTNIYGATESTAVVETDPANPANKVLHVKNTSYNTFVEIALPDGLTGANLTASYKKIKFKLYRPSTDSNDYTQVAVLLGNDKLYWDEGYPNQGEKDTWLDRSYDLAQITNDATTLLVGFNNNAIEFYIDDICLEGTGEEPVPTPAGPVRWTGAVSGTWDTVTANFADATAENAEEALATTFKSGSKVIFNDTLTYKAADPEPPVGPHNVIVAEYNFENGVLIGGWGNLSTREIVSGGHDGGYCEKINNPSELNPWEVQIAIDFDEPLTVEQEYVLHFWAKADTEVTLSAAFQNPSDYSGRGNFPSFTLKTDWKEYTLKTVVTGDNCKRLCFNLGNAVGDIYIDDVTVYYVEGASVEPSDKEKVTIASYNFEDDVLIKGWGNLSTREISENGHDGGKCEEVYNPSEVNPWEVQLAIDFDEPLTVEQEYVLHFWAKTGTEVTVGAAFQNPSNYSGCGDFPSFNLLTDWKEYTLKTIVTGENCKRLCFNLGKAVGTTYIDDVELYYEKETAGGETESTAKAKEPAEEVQEQTVTLAETITAGDVVMDNDNINYTFESATGAELLQGKGSLIVGGEGKVVLNIDNQLAGATQLNGGMLSMTKYVSETQLGKNIVADGGALDFSYNKSASAYPTVASAISIDEGKSIDLYTSRYCYWTSPLEGKGNVNLYCGGERTYISTSKGATIPDWSAFSGTVNIYPYKEVVDDAGFYGIVMGHGGKTFNPEAPAEKANEIFKNAKLVLNEGTAMACESGTRGFRIGELQMAKDTRIYGYYKASTPVSYFIVGGLGTDAVLEGQIAPTEKNGTPYIEQGVGLIKEGAGTYTLTNNNNMLTAGLRILDGRILINNDKAEAAENGLTGATGYTKSGTQTTVFGNGVLGGDGNLAADVDVYGKLEPGCDGIGTLTLKNYAATDRSVSLYVRPSTVIECEIESAESYDRIEVDGNVTFYNITEDFNESDNKPVVKVVLKDGFTYKAGEEYVLVRAKGKTSLNDVEWSFDVEKPAGEWIVEERTDESGYQLVLKADVPNAISSVTGAQKGITAANGIVYVSCEEPTEVNIYSAAGSLIKTVAAQRGINAIPAAKGVLIIKAGDMTGKVINE